MIDDQSIGIETQLGMTMHQLNKFVIDNKLIPELAEVWGCTPKTVHNRFEKRNLSAVEMCQMGQIEILRPLMANLLRSMANRFHPTSQKQRWQVSTLFRLKKPGPALKLLQLAAQGLNGPGVRGALAYSADDLFVRVGVFFDFEPEIIPPHLDDLGFRYTIPKTILHQGEPVVDIVMANYVASTGMEPPVLAKKLKPLAIKKRTRKYLLDPNSQLAKTQAEAFGHDYFQKDKGMPLFPQEAEGGTGGQ